MGFDKFDEIYRYNVSCLNEGDLSIEEYKFKQKLLIDKLIAEVKDTTKVEVKGNPFLNMKGENS